MHSFSIFFYLLNVVDQWLKTIYPEMKIIFINWFACLLVFLFCCRVNHIPRRSFSYFLSCINGHLDLLPTYHFNKNSSNWVDNSYFVHSCIFLMKLQHSESGIFSTVCGLTEIHQTSTWSRDKCSNLVTFHRLLLNLYVSKYDWPILQDYKWPN